MGKVITFEGIDGSGKTSVIEGVKQALESKGHKVLVLREPGTTVLGEKIRDLLKSDTVRHKSTDLYLFLASRNDMVKQVLYPASKLYDYILLDRYTDSTLAYQCYGNGHDLDTVSVLQRMITKDVRVDKTIFLDVTLEEAKHRRALRGESEDSYENSEFLQSVYDGYQEIIKREPDRFIVLKNNDLERTIQTATNAIIHQTKSNVSRQTLKKVSGEKITLRAIIARPGRDKEDKPTLLLKEIKKKGGRKVLTDHVWIQYTRELVKAGTLVPGDMIEFTAVATPYTKIYQGQTIEEYGISNITDVKPVKLVVLPDMEEDWGRSDLAYIHSVTQPEMYDELLSRYVRFLSAITHKYYNGGI